MNRRHVLIIDDHPIVRRGIAELLARGPAVYQVSEACNSSEALAAIWKHDWDLILLDLSLPGRSGLELLKEIKDLRPKLPVLVFSWYSEDLAPRVLQAGAAGYLTKDSPSETVLHAIDKVLKGEKYITSSVAEKLVAVLSVAIRPPHELLSDREYDVMIRIASGRTVGQIAAELHLSVKTISTYRARVFEKLGFKSNADLMQFAIRNKLVDCI